MRVVKWHERMQQVGPFKGVIQIVPSPHLKKLFDKDKEHNLPADGPADPAAGSDLQYHNGPVIDGGRARMFNVHLGTPSYNVADFDAFSKSLLVPNSYYISPDGRDTSGGTFLNSVTVAWPFKSMSIQDADIEAYVDAQVLSGAWPKQDGATMYALIFPAGTTVTMQGASSCSSFCGYHSMTSQGNYYQVINDTTCAGCKGGFTSDQSRMMVYAHEYAEWRSDPQGTGWWNTSTGMENADECAWNFVQWGPVSLNWAVQPFWVNGRGCVVGDFVAGGPPPPPPPPARKTTSMVFVPQPVSGQVGKPSGGCAVRLFDQNGVLADFDNSTVVSFSLYDSAGTFYKGGGPVTAVAGVCKVADIVPTLPHTKMFWQATATGLSTIKSNFFDIASGPTGGGGKASGLLTLTYPDGSKHTFTVTEQ